MRSKDGGAGPQTSDAARGPRRAPPRERAIRRRRRGRRARTRAPRRRGEVRGRAAPETKEIPSVGYRTTAGALEKTEERPRAALSKNSSKADGRRATFARSGPAVRARRGAPRTLRRRRRRGVARRPGLRRERERPVDLLRDSRSEPLEANSEIEVPSGGERGDGGGLELRLPRSRDESARLLRRPARREKRDVRSGSGCSRNVAVAMRPSVPREPTIIFGRSKPATFFTTLPPPLATAPSARTSVTPRTRSRSVP